MTLISVQAYATRHAKFRQRNEIFVERIIGLSRIFSVDKRMPAFESQHRSLEFLGISLEVAD